MTAREAAEKIQKEIEDIAIYHYEKDSNDIGLSMTTLAASLLLQIRRGDYD